MQTFSVDFSLYLYNIVNHQLMKETFAHRFKTARHAFGYSQKDLANKLKVTKQSISKYELSLIHI